MDNLSDIPSTSAEQVGFLLTELNVISSLKKMMSYLKLRCKLDEFKTAVFLL